MRPRLASLRLSPGREADVIEELSQHLDQRYEELREGGASDDDARRLALDELLEPGALADHMRSLRQARVPEVITPGAPDRFVAGLLQDLRYAVRVLRKEPGFTAAAVLTLALGIGANSAMFALVDAILLRPLPFPHPERLVTIWERSDTSPRDGVAPSNLVDWQERNRTFETIGGFVPNVGGMVLGNADGTAENVSRQWVTAGIFDALGLRPVAGRTFLAADDAQRLNVVVLSESFWRARFNADPAIAGRELRLDGEPWTVVGVVPDEAQVLGRASMWALRGISGLPAAARAQHALRTIGRFKADVTMSAANADLAAIANDLAREFPDTNARRGVAIEPLHDAVVGGELRRTSLLFLGVVGFVLLICCANVANLLLTRATVRKRELAIRSALGADRPRIIQLLLAESLVLSILGGSLGLVIGAAMLNIAPAVVPQQLLPAPVTLTVNLRVVLFCAAAALLVGAVFGIAPAWQATSLASPQALASDGRTITGRGRIRELLVVGEVATAVLLLFGAGLLLRTLLAVEHVDRGYRADSALTMLIDPPYQSRSRLVQFYEAVERDTRALPGVRNVAWATTLPLGRSYLGTVFFELAGETPPPESQRPTADYQVVSPGYFSTLDIPVVAGRGFSDRDTQDSVPVCMVNEAFVRRHMHGRSPIGVRVAMREAAFTEARPVVREIVGIARQVKGRPDETEDFVQVYVPLAQDTPEDIYLIVRPSSGRADALAPAVRRAIARLDTEQVVSVRGMMTLEGIASEATARHRFRAVLIAAFAGLALLLAMVGLFGILAYSVQQRVRDFGVRRVLGAGTADVLWLVFKSAARVIAIGTAIGLVLSAALGRMLATMLFGVQPGDPITFALVTATLTLTAAVSVAGPAWRATRIDPAVALRAE